MNEPIEFIDELRSLQDLECWGIVAGEGTGSRVALDFGQRIPRARPLKNPTLPEIHRQYKGEFGIFVQNCAWRLDSGITVCTSKSPNTSDGEMVRGLQNLVGRRVVSVLVTSPAHDLVIEFSDGIKLSLFCDCFDQERDGNNYSFHSLTNVFVVRAGSHLIQESKAKS
jgi:hypothetical protein